VRSQV